MFEDELRALSTMAPFSDPEIDSRRLAVAELRKAIQAVREIPGWSGDSTSSADALLQRMEKNATDIETALDDLADGLRTAADTAAGDASVALHGLPSASAEGLIADAGRGLAGITDGWGAFDTGEMVAQEEARLAAERETAAMNELKKIRGTLNGEAVQSFAKVPPSGVDPNSVPLPVIDVDGIDSGVPPVGSNAPSGGPGTSPGGTGVGSVAPPQVGTWVPGGGGDGGWVNGGNGGSGGGNTGTIGDNGWDNGDNGGSGGNGGSDPTVDSPIGGTLPGYPGGGGSGSGGGGGLLTGGSGGSGTLGAAVLGGAGAAALMGARSASLSGMSGATGPGGFGVAGSASGSASGGAGGSGAGAGGRSMAPGMMGGAAGDDEKRRDRSGLGGPIAPKLEDDEETGPRSRSAQAGSRDTLR